jgi:hypothetical protein
VCFLVHDQAVLQLILLFVLVTRVRRERLPQVHTPYGRGAQAQRTLSLRRGAWGLPLGRKILLRSTYFLTGAVPSSAHPHACRAGSDLERRRGPAPRRAACHQKLTIHTDTVSGPPRPPPSRWGAPPPRRAPPAPRAGTRVYRIRQTKSRTKVVQYMATRWTMV